MLFANLMHRVIRYGSLTIIDATGRVHRFQGAAFRGLPESLHPPPVTVRLHDRRLHWSLFFNPTLRIGEAYMDGSLTVEDGGSLYDFLALAVYNLEQGGNSHPILRLDRVLKRGLRWIHQNNPLEASRRNVAHHYDLSGEFYRLFLDPDMQYSCALFSTGTEPLAEAQAAKKRHIAAKLRLQPGQKVLDIGCGWGGMGLYLASQFDVMVQGVTLSTEQLGIARQRADAAGLNGRAEFFLRDYRFVEGRFDRIVSVGMFEHVGTQHYDEFFGTVRRLLAEDGVMVLHTIGRASPPGGTNAWLRKYIFPGGYSPALSELAAALEQAGLFLTDVEVLRHHYAETLRQWRLAFLAQQDQARRLYDDRFCRMWDFYLAGCEVVFRYSDQVVFQLQITRNRYAVPETRDYMVDEERRLPLAL